MAAPPPLRQTASTRVELREGGGCISLFGIPFGVAGVLMALAGAGVLPMRNASEGPWWGPAALAAMGMVFLAAGGALTFGRRRTIFDVAQGRVIREWVIVILAQVLPISRTERGLSEFDAVVIAFESDPDSADTYPVRLQGRTGKDFKVSAPTRFEKSRRLAEFLAGFLGLNLADRSTGHELLLSPQLAGQSLPERLGSGAAQPERVVRPMRMRSDVDVRDGEVRIVIPGRGSPALAAAVAVAGIATAPFLARPLLQFFRQTGTPEVVPFTFVAFLAVALGIRGRSPLGTSWPSTTTRPTAWSIPRATTSSGA